MAWRWTDARYSSYHRRVATQAADWSGVLAVLEGRRSGDQGGAIAIDALVEAAAAGGKIVHEFRLVEPQVVEVDQVHVGAQARRPLSRPHQTRTAREFRRSPLSR